MMKLLQNENNTIARKIELVVILICHQFYVLHLIYVCLQVLYLYFLHYIFHVFTVFGFLLGLT